MGSGSETASVFRMSESGYSGRMLASARGGTVGALLGGPHYYGPSGGRRGVRTLALRAPSAVRRAIAEGRQCWESDCERLGRRQARVEHEDRPQAVGCAVLGHTVELPIAALD